jgi:MYXO-CTERM domain-containing protein
LAPAAIEKGHRVVAKSGIHLTCHFGVREPPRIPAWPQECAGLILTGGKNFAIPVRMRTKRARRKQMTVPRSRWLAYATAGAATAFASSHSLEAAIHYSGLLNVTFGPRHNERKTFQLDQHGDSFRLEHDAASYFAGFQIRGLGSAFFRINTPSYYFVKKLHSGDNVVVGYFARHGSRPDGFGAMANSYGSGAQWNAAGIGFVGFRFTKGTGFQYGWARVTMGGKQKKNGFKLVDYAYAGVGESITAGQTTSDEQPPIAGSLGWLALGGAGLIAWRRRSSGTKS